MRPSRVNHQIKIGVKAVLEQILEEERRVELYLVSGQLPEQFDKIIQYSRIYKRWQTAHTDAFFWKYALSTLHSTSY
jgi:hypothetical protein